jgi:hypothetical protein
MLYAHKSCTTPPRFLDVDVVFHSQPGTSEHNRIRYDKNLLSIFAPTVPKVTGFSTLFLPLLVYVDDIFHLAHFA